MNINEKAAGPRTSIGQRKVRELLWAQARERGGARARARRRSRELAHCQK